MATTYVSMANLTKYDTLLKAYIADGWYDKIEIDQFIATIEQREANYVDRSVNDLVNYYTKSQTYTKAETNALISTIPTFSIEVVDELPTEDISTTTIYLLRNDGSEAGNIFTEYLYVDDEWEVLGSQSIDLSDYYTCEEVDYLIPKKVSDLQNDAGYIRQIDIDSNMVAGIRGVNDIEFQKGYVTIDKQMVGLSLVENKSSQQILGQLIDTNVTSALGFMPLNAANYVQNSSTQDGFVPKSNGMPNKVWGTDSNGIPGWINGSGGGGGGDVTGVKGSAEASYRTGNVSISKDNIGLGNVENKSSAIIRGELTSENVTNALGYTPVRTQISMSVANENLVFSQD